MATKSFQFFVIAAFFVNAGNFANAFGGQDAAQYLLRFQFHEGEQLRYESSKEMTMKAIGPGGQKVDRSKVKQRRLFRIGKVNTDGSADVSMQFEHVRMETQSDDRPEIVFDSAMKDSEVPKYFRGAAHKLKGSAPEYVVRTTGTDVSDDGYEQLPENGQASFMFPLPGEPVAVGDSWKVFMNVKVRVSEGVMRNIKLLRTYKLASVKDDVADIRFSTSVAVRVRSPSVRSLLLEATPQGRIMFDIANGKVIQKEITFEQSVLGALGEKTMLTADGKTVETLLDSAAESSVSKR